jgi:hypothetical protein
MKKIALYLVIAFTSIQLSAQAEPILKSKKGNYILPQTGDWGIGVNADPFLVYLGNMFFIDNINQAPVFEPNNLDQSITVKYFKDEKHAYRFGLMLQNRYQGVKIDVEDLNPNAAPNAKVNNFIRTSHINVMLSAGLERRRGASRLQGIYGAQANIGYGSGDRMWYKYGNDMEYYSAAVGPTRNIRQPQSAPKINIGLSGFVGIEYFFAPKISIGGTFFVTTQYTQELAYTFEVENWDDVEKKSVFETTKIDNRISSFQFFTNNMGGNLQFMFYF